LISNAQKKYVFDYKIEFANKNSPNEKNLDAEYWKLIISKDNSYQLRVKKVTRRNYELEIIDLNGLIASFKIKKEIFNDLKGYAIACTYVSSYDADYHNVTDNYKFEHRTDTIINNKEHFVYDFTLKEGKNERLEGNYFRYFVQKNDTINAKPLFENWEAYTLYKSYNIPSGIYTKMVFGTPDKIVGEATIYRVSQISKHFIIPKKCDYTIVN